MKLKLAVVLLMAAAIAFGFFIGRFVGVPSGGPQIMAGATNTPSSYDRGVASFQRQEWNEAIANFDEAIRLNPKDALAYEYRAGIYYGKGDFDHAIIDYGQAIRLDPTNVRAYGNRGSAYRAKQEFDKAILDFSEWLRLDSTNDLAYKSRAACYSAKSEFDKAISDWTEGLRLSPGDAIALASRGWAHFMSSQFDEAVQDYTEALRLDPTNDLAYNNLGWLYATSPAASKRNGKAAVEMAKRACELTKWARWDWIDTLAAAYAEAGDFEKAIEYQKQAIDMSGASDQQHKDMERRLSLYQHRQPNHDGQKQ